MSDKTVQLTDSASNQSSTLPLLSGSLGEPAIDIGKCRRKPFLAESDGRDGKEEILQHVIVNGLETHVG